MHERGNDGHETRLRRSAWTCAVLVWALLVAVASITFANGSFSVEGGFIGVAFAMILGYSVIGGFVASRLPRNPIGWLMLAVAGAFAIAGLTDEWVTYAFVTNPGALPFATFAAWLTNFVFLLVVVPLPFILVLFPTGRPPSPRWRGVLGAFAGALVLGALGTIVKPGPIDTGPEIHVLNPTGVASLAGVGDIATTIAGVVGIASALLAACAPFVRFRGASGEERQQIRWLAYVTALAGVALAIAIVTGLGLGPNETSLANDIAFYVFFGMLALGIPAAIAVALLKYRLWDLDIVVKKALVAGIVLVAFASLSLLVLVIVGGEVVGPLRDRPGLTLLAGAAIGACLWPILRLSRSLADRVVYGGRATPYEVLAEFSDRLAETYSSDDVLPRTAAILGEGTGAERVTVWLLVGGEALPAATWPADADGPAPGPDAFEVRHQGELLGTITATMPANDPMNPAKERLFRDLAGQAGLVLRNVRLIEDLRASRRRLVAAQDEERRRIERNIHDGAQQELVALAVKIRLTEALVGKDDEKVRAMLDDLQQGTTDALENLRDLARGIYPPLLADKGLAGALEAQSRKSTFPVEISHDGVARYPRDVEAAVYFCVLESLQNVAKYAGATRVRVRLEAGEEAVRFAVSDDGVGFDVTTAKGSGITNMRDRLEALGGSLDLRSAPGDGTTVSGMIPARPS